MNLSKPLGPIPIRISQTKSSCDRHLTGHVWSTNNEHELKSMFNYRTNPLGQIKKRRKKEKQIIIYGTHSLLGSY